MSASYYLTALFDNCIPQRQLLQCDQTLPLSAWGVVCETMFFLYIIIFDCFVSWSTYSLDAGAISIQVTTKSGGLKLLQIQDNGCGIKVEQRLLIKVACLQLHICFMYSHTECETRHCNHSLLYHCDCWTTAYFYTNLFFFFSCWLLNGFSIFSPGVDWWYVDCRRKTCQSSVSASQPANSKSLRISQV